MPPSHFPRCSVTDIFSEVFRQSEYCCISPFYNGTDGVKDWAKAADTIVRCCLRYISRKKPGREASRLNFYSMQMVVGLGSSRFCIFGSDTRRMPSSKRALTASMGISPT